MGAPFDFEIDEQNCVVFTKENFRKFLKYEIKKWTFLNKTDFLSRDMACIYVDAYQQMHMALFGETYEEKE